MIILKLRKALILAYIFEFLMVRLTTGYVPDTYDLSYDANNLCHNDDDGHCAIVAVTNTKFLQYLL